MVRRVLLVAAIASCSGEIITAQPDGSVDASDSTVADATDETISDAGADNAWWFSQFDVAPFDGCDPPLVGEYPDPKGVPCHDQPNEIASCDPFTCWECSGLRAKNHCVCGLGWGCLPPQICCLLPEASAPECVADFDACPGDVTPWHP